MAYRMAVVGKVFYELSFMSFAEYLVQAILSLAALVFHSSAHCIRLIRSILLTIAAAASQEIADNSAEIPFVFDVRLSNVEA